MFSKLPYTSFMTLKYLLISKTITKLSSLGLSISPLSLQQKGTTSLRNFHLFLFKEIASEWVTNT